MLSYVPFPCFIVLIFWVGLGSGVGHNVDIVTVYDHHVEIYEVLIELFFFFFEYAYMHRIYVDVMNMHSPNQ